MAWLMLAGSVIFETFADTSMKLSDGFRKKAWIVGIAVGYLVSFYLMSHVLAELPLGLTYAIWTGVSIVLTAIVGRIIWKELFTWKKALGMTLIIVGVALLRMGA